MDMIMSDDVFVDRCLCHAMQIRTSFDREVTSPQHPFTIGKKWTTVQPAGSKIVGLFCRHVSPSFPSLKSYSFSIRDNLSFTREMF